MASACTVRLSLRFAPGHLEAAVGLYRATEAATKAAEALYSFDKYLTTLLACYALE